MKKKILLKEKLKQYQPKSKQKRNKIIKKNKIITKRNEIKDKPLNSKNEVQLKKEIYIKSIHLKNIELKNIQNFITFINQS